jgi:hypothetical protein
MKYTKTGSYQRLSSDSVREKALILLCLIGLAFAFFSRNLVYFRDYAITFEGGYRLFLGQIPFRDFFSPVGPGSFLLPALFFKVFSPNWTVFLYVQQFENFLFILLLYGILVRLHVRSLILCISLITFSLCYLLLQTHPWYNTTAILLMFAVVWLSLFPRIIYIINAGLFVGVAILTKQDVGLLSFFIGGFCIAILSLGSNLDQFLPSLESLKNRTLVRIMIKRLLFFFLSAAFVVFIFATLTNSQKFIYWFNYGQAPHSHRAILHWGLLGYLLTLLPGLFFNNFRLFLAGVFLVIASITQKTSGLEFTHYYYVAFIP